METAYSLNVFTNAKGLTEIEFTNELEAEGYVMVEDIEEGEIWEQ